MLDRSSISTVARSYAIIIVLVVLCGISALITPAFLSGAASTACSDPSENQRLKKVQQENHRQNVRHSRGFA